MAMFNFLSATILFYVLVIVHSLLIYLVSIYLFGRAELIQRSSSIEAGFIFSPRLGKYTQQLYTALTEQSKSIFYDDENIDWAYDEDLYFSDTNKNNITSNRNMPQRNPENYTHSTFFAASKKEFLLFSSVGLRGEKAIDSWIDGAGGKCSERLFDIVLYFYEENKYSSKNFELCKRSRFVHCLFRPDHKWPNLYHYLTSPTNSTTQNAEGKPRTSYKAIFAVDDDIQMSPCAINNMFRIFTQYQLKFAQPAYDGKGSAMHFRFQRWRGNTLMFHTNFVENAAMVLDASVLLNSHLLTVMKHGKSGYGTDYCFFEIVDTHPHEIGVIHKDVIALHPRTTDPTTASVSYWKGIENSVRRLDNKGLIIHSGPMKRKEMQNRKDGFALMRKCGVKHTYPQQLYFRSRLNDTLDDVLIRASQLPPSKKLRFYKAAV